MSIMFLVFPSLDRHVHFLQSFCWNFMLQIIINIVATLSCEMQKSQFSRLQQWMDSTYVGSENYWDHKIIGNLLLT